MCKGIKLTLAIYCVLSICGSFLVQAQSPQWLDQETVGIVRIDLKSNSFQGILEGLEKLLPSATNEIGVMRREFMAVADAIRSAGGEELLIVYSLADDLSDQPLWVAPKTKGLDVQLLERSFPYSQVLQPESRQLMLKSFETNGSTVIGSEIAVERVMLNKSRPPQALLEVVSRPRNPFIMLLTMNADQRRAAWEMLPKAPSSLGGGATRELLSTIQWLRVDLVDEKPTSLQVTVAGDTAGIESRWKKFREFLESSTIGNSTPLPTTLGKFLLNQFAARSPKSEGQTTTWKVPIESVLKSGDLEPVDAAIMQAHEQNMQSQLSALALGVLNYNSAMRRLPSCLRGINGKTPRNLSWRVDLLPFLGMNDLYQQFHLDEPWDSPHNKSLIPLMPNVFRASESKHTTRSGLSTFALPSSAVTMWPADQEVGFSEVEDGLSNTIMIVEINDEFAQEWTKPDPFELNIENPTSQLGGHFKNRVFFALADGSAGYLESESYGNLPALLTRSGGETIEW